jgi:lipopolysaccharide/colanic/teichoic acid biosynthesis glycosyltransferase
MGGDHLIREQVDDTAAISVPPAHLYYRVATDPPVERPAKGADLAGATSEMQLLVDVPEDWPKWSFSRRAGKRALDVVLSTVAICFLLPVLVLIAVAIRMESPGPVLYRQRRCGRNGRCFEVLKFRSMVREADLLLVDLRDRNHSDGLLFKVRGDPRVTRIGAFIRKYSIDELPQLINILKGDMSLVGPRPLAVNPNAFGPIDSRRHAVRPGLTCHWQISDRSRISYGQMVEMDLAYIRESSIWTDLRLMFLTLPVAATGKAEY